MNWSLWARWVVATLLGAGAGWTAGLYAAAALAEGNRPFNSNAIWIVAGFCIGLAQWLVIRTHLKRAWQWLFASVVGWVVAFNVGALVLDTMTGVLNGPGLDWFEAAAQVNATITGFALLFVVWFLIGAAGGAVVGGTQWLVLRQYYPHTEWWVAVNALGWGIGVGVSWFALLGIFYFFSASLSSLAPGIAEGTPIAFVSGAVSGALTGYALIRITKK